MHLRHDSASCITSAAGTASPLRWPWALSTPPLISSETTTWTGALLRRWRGTSPVMVQPPLDQHYIVMHEGGTKRVARRRDGVPVSTLVDRGALTLVPAGTSFTWHTSGPIAFAHLYVAPAQLEAVIERELDVESTGASLFDRVGVRDPQLEPLFERMMDEIEAGTAASSVRLDCLLECFLIRLARNYVSHRSHAKSGVLQLAPYRLRRVIDFIEANLDRDIGLADLVAAAGSSQFHFSRAFHAATGSSPYSYLIGRRIEYAKVLLSTGNQPLDAVRAACGFNSRHQFAVMFNRLVGIPPKRFSMLYRPPRRATGV